MKSPTDAELEHLSNAKALMQEVETRALYGFAAEVPSNQAIVEVGSWAGGSAAWLCAGSNRGNRAHVTCVDIWTDWIDPPPEQDPWRGADAFGRFSELVDWSITTALHGPSLDAAKLWVKPIGLLFIDALHTYEGCRDDYLAWSGHVPSGGVLAIHDYMQPPRGECWWTEGPTQAVDEIVVGSGLWTSVEVIGAMWVARRK